MHNYMVITNLGCSKFSDLYGIALTVKILKIRTPEKFAVIILNFEHRIMCPKSAGGRANSVDPDQTAPLGSGSALFAQVYLSKNLGSLRYSGFC